jgi:hypothetical protein
VYDIKYRISLGLQLNVFLGVGYIKMNLEVGWERVDYILVAQNRKHDNQSFGSKKGGNFLAE